MAEEERDFVKLDLGPLLALKHPHVQLMVHDDQRTNLEAYAAKVLAGKLWAIAPSSDGRELNGGWPDPDAAKYIDGVGMHWCVPKLPKLGSAGAHALLLLQVRFCGRP